MKGKIDIIASLTPPSIHDVWLNLNDNKLYRYGADGWMSLLDNRKPGQSGGSTNSAVQSDWLANKPVLPEYIKNRTHYLEVISTYNKPGTYDFPNIGKQFKFALIKDGAEDIIVDVPDPHYVVNITEHVQVVVLGNQFELQELSPGFLKHTPLKIVVINKHLNESYLPEDIKADFMQPDEGKQSFIFNNPFFNWRQIILDPDNVGSFRTIQLGYKASVILSNGYTTAKLIEGNRYSIKDKVGIEIAQIKHNGTYLECYAIKSGVFWITQANSVARWDAPEGEMGYIRNKPFNAGYTVSGNIGYRVTFTNAAGYFNNDTLRLRYEGKYYRLPYLTNVSVNIDNAFSITLINTSVSGSNQSYTYITQDIDTNGRDQTFTIESNIGATELCDLNIPNTIARNWKILEEPEGEGNFYYNPNRLENHTYYRLRSTSKSPIYGIYEGVDLITALPEVLEVKFFIDYAGSKDTPFSFTPFKSFIHWEGGFPELKGQSVEITLKYIGGIRLGSVKIYE